MPTTEMIVWLAGTDRPRQLRSLTVLRSAVEPVAAGLAAVNATPEQCAALTEEALGMVATSRASSSRGGELLGNESTLVCISAYE